MSAPSRTTTWPADAAAAAPDRWALLEPGREPLTYAELARLAGARAAEIAADDGPVEIELAPGIDHAVAFHAALIAGRPAFTVRPGLPVRERAAVRETARAPVGRPDVAARVLSSGTSGPRRAVDLTIANFEAAAFASAARLGVEEDDVWLACLPMDHVGGLSILVRSAIYRTTALIHPRFDTDAVAAALAGDSPAVTAVSLVPTQLARLLDAGADWSGLRFALIGGAPLPASLLDRALAAGVPLAVTYGLTEACSQVTTSTPAEARERPGSSGRPLPGIELRLGSGGAVEVRGPTVAPGAAGPDGWLRTGDVGRMDADGYLWVTGRADDLIVSGGENVRPEPVEERLLEHPAVLDAAVAGAPDPEWGEAVVAFVVLAGGPRPSARELTEHCREALAPASIPKRVEFVPGLPRTASGKLLRRHLR
jgi:o-succinylbenzoate---CoA ligase